VLPRLRAAAEGDTMTAESSGAMLARMGTDAEVWAREFAEVFSRLGDGVVAVHVDPTPGGPLHAWLCNAIEAGRSAGYSEGLRAAKLRERLRWRLIEARHRFDVRVATPATLAVVLRMPGWLRMWVVVDATNEARRLYPDPSGYAGPDGLTFSHIYDGALRRRRA
jgi:hypothetical protein